MLAPGEETNQGQGPRSRVSARWCGVLRALRVLRARLLSEQGVCERIGPVPEAGRFRDQILRVTLIFRPVRDQHGFWSVTAMDGISALVSARFSCV